jgi:hypothetical protein
MLNGDWYLSDAEPQEISEGYIRPVRRVRGPDLAQNPAGHGSDVACEIRALRDPVTAAGHSVLTRARC